MTPEQYAEEVDRTVIYRTENIDIAIEHTMQSCFFHFERVDRFTVAEFRKLCTALNYWAQILVPMHGSMTVYFKAGNTKLARLAKLTGFNPIHRSGDWQFYRRTTYATSSSSSGNGSCRSRTGGYAEQANIRS